MKLILFIVLAVCLSTACDENCFEAPYRTQYLFHLELINVSTGNNLFLGNDALYPLDSFQLYRMRADTLSDYSYHTFEEHSYFVINCQDVYDYTPDISTQAIIDTFYFKIPDSGLNELTFEFNRIKTECDPNFVENYDVRLNGNLVCEGCTHNDEIVILD